MFVSNKEVYDWIIRKSEPLSNRHNGLQPLIEYIHEQYNVPNDIITDILYERIETVEATQDSFILFALVKGICHIRNIKIPDFFTEEEEKEWSELKYKVKRKKIFPIELDMIEVNPDQWIGKIDCKWLMSMSANGLIKYNPDTQRPLKRINNGSETKYVISLNKQAVESIREAYRNHSYISNDITLNMGDDSNADYDYDEVNKKLIIKRIDHFDIPDGYHRYYAANLESLHNPNFNVNFVLHLTEFTEKKAQQYIFQQDTRTPIPKIEVMAFNRATPEAETMEVLTDPISGCAWKDEIKKSHKGKIDYAELNQAIRLMYYFKRTKANRSEVRKNAKQIINGIKAIDFEMDEIPEFNYVMVVALIYCIKNNIDIDETIDILDTVGSNEELQEKFKSKSSGKISKGQLQILEDYILNRG